MSRARIQDDGSLMFPRRGAPPLEVPGVYLTDPNNPYHLILNPASREIVQETVNVEIDRDGFKEIWLAGKGPSLDTFDWSKAGPMRIGINEVAFLIPKCWGAIAYDQHIHTKYILDLDPNVVVFRRMRDIQYTFPKMYLWNKEVRARYNLTTLNVALELFYFLGCRLLHLVGCDSWTGDASYAESIKNIQAEGDNPVQYKDVNDRLRAQIQDFDDLTIIWEHLDARDLVRRKGTEP